VAISAPRTTPVKFPEANLGDLKRGGLIRGQRERSGGYRLARGKTSPLTFGLASTTPSLGETEYYLSMNTECHRPNIE
jgi:hypothetical protein